MRITCRVSLFLLIVAVALLASGDGRGVIAAYNPTAAVTLTARTTTTRADTTVETKIASGDYNTSLLVYGTPSLATLARGPGYPGYNGTTEPALGDVVGQITISGTFGLGGHPCASSLTVAFPLLNATVDNSSGNVINAVPQSSAGPAGVLEPMWTDDGDYINNQGQTVQGSATTNGLPAQVDKYPSYLNTLFDPDGTAGAVQPRARYVGAISLAGTVTTLNIVVFAENVLADAFSPPNPFDDLGGIGYTAVTVFNDPTQPGAPGNNVSDWCSPLTTTLVPYGNSKVNPCKNVTTVPCDTARGINSPAPGASTNKARYANPGTAGTYRWFTFQQSLRDLDGDGKENNLDPCPATSDALNPRLIGGDPANDSDYDQIPGPTECDSTINPGSFDQDGDGWANALDNCPQSSNSTNAEAESTGQDKVARPRGGPKTDSMGDACDSGETSCAYSADDDHDGLINDGCATYGGTAEVGCLNNADDDADTRVNDGCPSSSQVANGRYYATFTLSPICIGGADADGDGWCSSATPTTFYYDNPSGPDTVSLSDPNDANVNITPEHYALTLPFPITESGADGLTFKPTAGPGTLTSAPARQPAQVCNDGIDQDSDGAKDIADAGCTPPINLLTTAYTDTDQDGFSDELEVYLGTDVLGHCEVGGTLAVPSSDWPADLEGGNDSINIADLTMFQTPVFRLFNGPTDANWDQRYDLAPDAYISVGDMVVIINLKPPMDPFNGSGANLGPPCTADTNFGD